MANKGTSNVALSNPTTKGESWIIDYGASEHMTSNEKLLISIIHSKSWQPQNKNGKMGHLLLLQAYAQFKLILHLLSRMGVLFERQI